MKKICRTCLSPIGTDQLYYNLTNPSEGSSGFLIKTKLKSCVPELSIDLLGISVICDLCLSKLGIAYAFKSKCLETEAKIHDYIANVDCTKGNCISEILEEIANGAAETNVYSNKDIVKVIEQQNKAEKRPASSTASFSKRICLDDDSNNSDDVIFVPNESTVAKLLVDVNNKHPCINVGAVSIIAVPKTAPLLDTITPSEPISPRLSAVKATLAFINPCTKVSTTNKPEKVTLPNSRPNIVITDGLKTVNEDLPNLQKEPLQVDVPILVNNSALTIKKCTPSTVKKDQAKTQLTNSGKIGNTTVTKDLNRPVCTTPKNIKEFAGTIRKKKLRYLPLKDKNYLTILKSDRNEKKSLSHSIKNGSATTTKGALSSPSTKEPIRNNLQTVQTGLSKQGLSSINPPTSSLLHNNKISKLHFNKKDAATTRLDSESSIVKKPPVVYTMVKNTIKTSISKARRISRNASLCKKYLQVRNANELFAIPESAQNHSVLPHPSRISLDASTSNSHVVFNKIINALDTKKQNTKLVSKESQKLLNGMDVTSKSHADPVTKSPLNCIVKLIKLSQQELCKLTKTSNLCNFCGFKSVETQKLIEHYKALHVDKLYFCSLCTYVTPDFNSLNLHVDKVHLVKIDSSAVENVYKCKICEFNTHKRTDALIHRKLHLISTCILKHKCDFCFYSTSIRVNFERHIKNHFKDTFYICNYCGNGFSNKEKFKNHIIDHSTFMFKCIQCNFQSVHIDHLRNHYLDTHYLKGPFKCSHCQQVFKLRVAIVSHILNLFCGKYVNKTQICMEHSYASDTYYT